MQTSLCPNCHRAHPPGATLCPKATPAEASLHQTVTSGLKIGEYIVEGKLGEGGMGEVWSGKHPQIGKQVAIKILSRNLSTNENTVARFIQEARAVNEIQHRNIVDIFSFGELPDKRPYFVMEYLRGKSLSDYLREKGTLPFSILLPIFEQICSALQACHEQNIVHRDLKPDNIFLVFGGGSRQESIFVKLLDFGIAKLDSSGKENLTGSGVMMGTPAYMSPEQCEGAKNVDASSDIYSLGVILFELLTGRTPFREPNDGLGVIISKHMFMPPPPPSSMVSGRKLPFALDLLVLKALSKKPADRPSSCLAFYDDLVSAIGTQSSETGDSLHQAKPIYESGQGISEPLKKSATEELAKKQNTPAPSTKDSLGTAETMAHSIVRASSRARMFGAAGLVLLLIGGVIYLLGASGESATTKANPPTLAPPPAPLESSAKQVQVPLEKIQSESQPSPSSQKAPEEKPAPKAASPKNKKKADKKKDALLLQDDD